MRYSRTFFEGEKTSDNKTSKTHSHIWKKAEGESKKTPHVKTKDDAAPRSAQNITLAKAILETFQFHLDLNVIEPFNQGIIYSRPCEQIYLNLEFCNFADWLRVCCFFKKYYLLLQSPEKPDPIIVFFFKTLSVQ